MTFDPLNPQPTLQALEEMLSTPESTIMKMGQAAREKVRIITPEKSSEIILQSIASVLQGRSKVS